MGLQAVPLQNPNTPNVKPLKEPSDMDFMMGVERTAIKSKPKAMSNSTDKGDAGRSILTANVGAEPMPGTRRTGKESGQRR